MRWVLLFGSFISCTLTCLLTFPSGTEIEMEGIGGTTDQSGQLFEWNLCDDPLMQLGCEDGTRICQTTKEGVKKSCGSNLTLEGKSDSLRIHLKGGTVGCGGIERRTEIQLYCDEPKPPVVHEDSRCSYILKLSSYEYCTTKNVQKDFQEEVQEKRHWKGFCESPLAQNLGELKFTAGGKKYVVNLCSPLTDKTKCEGALVCQYLPDGKSKSLGTGPLISLGNDNYEILNGTVGCGGKTRKTTIAFPPNCRSGNITILEISEPLKCEYNLTLGDISCKPKPPPQPKPKKAPPTLENRKYRENLPHQLVDPSFCNLMLLRKGGPGTICLLGKTYGCSDSGMWVSGKCSGKFRCRGKDVLCTPHMRHCAC